MEIFTYKTNPEKLESVLERIISRGESTGSWVAVHRMGKVGLESSTGCMSRVRVEIEEGESATEAG